MLTILLECSLFPFKWIIRSKPSIINSNNIILYIVIILIIIPRHKHTFTEIIKPIEHLWLRFSILFFFFCLSIVLVLLLLLFSELPLIPKHFLIKLCVIIVCTSKHPLISQHFFVGILLLLLLLLQ